MGINTEHINTGRIDTGGVWIIVPAFNESAVIGEVITQLRSEFSHVVCVDDGSSDDTASTALDRKSTRLNSSHIQKSRMPSSA